MLSNVLNQSDTIVYGVEVPGVEGRAGMAAIVEPSGGLDLKYFLSAVKNQLPSCATPIFLRLVQNLDITGQNIKSMCTCFRNHEKRHCFYQPRSGMVRRWVKNIMVVMIPLTPTTLTT